MSLKASFSNVANELLDWDDVQNDDFCSWRGVYCDNVSLSVVSLYVSLLPSFQRRLVFSYVVQLLVLEIVYRVILFLASSLTGALLRVHANVVILSYNN